MYSEMSEQEKIEETKRLLLQENMELELRSAFEQQHKQAFRTAFDFLRACFPPTRKENYWNTTVELFKHRVENNKQNPLVKHLLLGVYNYLGEIINDLPKEETDENSQGNV